MQLLKEVFMIDINGHITDVLIKDFDEDGNCIEELPEDVITVDPPQGLIRSRESAHWTGTEWIEPMTEEEYIATLPKQPDSEPKLTEEQQRLTDLELAIAEILGGGL